MKKLSMALLFVIVLTGTALAQPTQDWEEVFCMADPQGDAFGPGDYSYPEHSSFPPELADMLDLVEFRVANSESATRFEFTFVQPPDLVQPWGGAGYNFHRIDLYIAPGGDGRTETFRPGAQVEFAMPWQVNLRIRDWNGAYLIHWEDNPDDTSAGIWQENEGFEVFVQDNTIVVEVDHQHLGPATSQWRYYVLVGLQDAYGPDQYRKVCEERGPWAGGGGSETEFNPNVYDILADTVQAQGQQLDWDAGRLAKLQPVPAGRTGLYRIITIAGIILVAAGVAVFIWAFRK